VESMTKTKWTKEQIDFLTENYRQGEGLSLCVTQTGKTPYSVKQKARRLGLSGIRRLFSLDEKEFIRKNYPSMGPRRLAKIMPGVNWMSIFTFAQKNGIKAEDGLRGRISSETNKTWVRSEKTKSLISQKAKERVGEKNGNWKGGITPLRTIVNKMLWPVWIYPILLRDGFECQSCGYTGNELNVHHLVPYRSIRDSIIKENPGMDNMSLAKLIVLEHHTEDGITICLTCHRKIHFEKWGGMRGTLTVEDEGNPQLSRENVLDFVSRKAQRLTVDDAQTNTTDKSAPLSIISVGR
jgi:hypothetical protein